MLIKFVLYIATIVPLVYFFIRSISLYSEASTVLTKSQENSFMFGLALKYKYLSSKQEEASNMCILLGLVLIILTVIYK